MRIGIDIGGSHIAVGLVDNKGNIVIKKEKNINSDGRKNIDKLIEETIAVAINEILRDNNIKIEDIEKIGIACPGTSKDGVVVKAENLGIYDFHIVEKLQRYFSAPIKLSNDAKCAGLCEKKYGALKEYDDAIFMCLGTGIGGAVFMNGRMLVPKRHLGMEIGHTLLKKDGLKCNCGRNGCFEVYASMKRLRDRIAQELNLSEDLNGEIIFELAKREIEKIDDLLEEFADSLAEGITNLVNIFEPEAICIGGSYVYHTDILGDKVDNALKKAKMYNGEIPKIVLAQFENDSGMIRSNIIIDLSVGGCGPYISNKNQETKNIKRKGTKNNGTTIHIKKL